MPACRFQGVNWRDKANWGCNQRMNPTGEKWMDGITISPHELMFVKVKDHLLLSTNSLAIAARKYSDWMDGLVRKSIIAFLGDRITKTHTCTHGKSHHVGQCKYCS